MATRHRISLDGLTRDETVVATMLYGAHASKRTCLYILPDVVFRLLYETLIANPDAIALVRKKTKPCSREEAITALQGTRGNVTLASAQVIMERATASSSEDGDVEEEEDEGPITRECRECLDYDETVCVGCCYCVTCLMQSYKPCAYCVLTGDEYISSGEDEDE